MTKTEKHLRAEVTRFVRANKGLYDKLGLQSQSIAKLSADVNKAEAERDREKAEVIRLNLIIDQMANGARKQREVHRTTIMQLLDRYDVIDPRLGEWTAMAEAQTKPARR